MITSFFKKNGPAVSTTPKRAREGGFEDKNERPLLHKRRFTKDSPASPGGQSQQEQQNNKHDENSLPFDVQELIKCLNCYSDQSSAQSVPCDTALEGEGMESVLLTKTVELPKATWRDALDKHMASPSFARLAKFVAEER
jgi:hypothetical protein